MIPAEPPTMKELQSILAALAQHQAKAAVLATLVRVEGSSYRRPGARLLLLEDGTRCGSISGGCLEDDVVTRAQAVLASGKPQTVVYDTTSENDLVWGTGLGCHGIVRVLLEKLPPAPVWAAVLRANLSAGRDTLLAVGYDEPAALGTQLAADEKNSAGIFLETVAPPTPLVIFGAGDDARPLSRFAKELGWHVTIADSRPGYVTAARFPEADEFAVGHSGSPTTGVALSPRTVAVIMTHRYKDDLPLLRALLPQPLAYLGLLGPKKRAERMLETLGHEGLRITAEMHARLHAPVGLDLGATTPETVALSILAEIQARLGGRTPIHLRERTAPIHD